MMEPDGLALAGVGAAAYLMGSLPWGYWAVRAARGIDVREVGSGNIGTANVWRAAGPCWAALVLGLDVSKGALPVLAASTLVHGNLAPVVAGAAALLGHSRSIFLGFGGGKAVATGLGVFLALQPLAALGCVGVFAAAFAATRKVSAASVPAALSLPLWLLVVPAPPLYLGLGYLAAGWITWRHRANLRRLAAGEEPEL